MQIEYAPGRYFDLEDLYKDLFTITAVTMGDRGEPILTFANAPGRLPLNATDVPRLIKAFGEDPNSWIGREISITPQLNEHLPPALFPQAGGSIFEVGKDGCRNR